MNPICVALDARESQRNLEIARAVSPHVGYVKIGLTSFTGGGNDLAEELATIRPLFVDLKLHDIPMQVEGAMSAVAATGAAYTTVHGLGGRDMLRAAVDAAGDTIVLAVTILTSMDSDALAKVGIEGTPEDGVLRLAEVALDAGAGGLVCSPHEVAAIRARYGMADAGGPLLVVPGIRSGTGTDDQRRTLTARDAVERGADVIVVGRPITGAADPAAAAASLLDEIS